MERPAIEEYMHLAELSLKDFAAEKGVKVLANKTEVPYGEDISTFFPEI